MINLLLTLVFLLSPVLYGAVQKAEPKILMAELEKMFSEDPSERQKVISSFKVQMQKAPAKEKKVWGGLISALEKYNEDNDASIKNFLSVFAGALEGFQKLYPDSNETQTQFVDVLSQLAITMKDSKLSMEKRSSELLKKSLSTIEKFVKAHPKDAKGYETLAVVLERNERKKTEIADAYAKCLELNAKNRNCKAGYAAINSQKTEKN